MKSKSGSKIGPKVTKIVREVILIAQEATLIFKDSRIITVAQSLAYVTILSIIPILAVGFAIFQGFGGLEKLYDMIQPIILENLASSSGKDAMEIIQKSIGKVHAGALGIGGFIAMLITSMSLLNTAEQAINRIWKTEDKRPLFYRITAYWLFISLGPLALSIIIGAVTVQKLTFTKIFPPGVLGFLLVVFLFFWIYKLIPTCKVKILSALTSALFTSVCWSAAKWGYSIYVSQVVTYHKIYGSLGAIPILLLWIYISWLIVLTGASLGYATQKRLEAFKH